MIRYRALSQTLQHLDLKIQILVRLLAVLPCQITGLCTLVVHIELLFSQHLEILDCDQQNLGDVN